MWHAASVEFGSAACRWLFDTLAQTKQRSEVLPQVQFLLTGTGPRREACREHLRSTDPRQVTVRLLMPKAASGSH